MSLNTYRCLTAVLLFTTLTSCSWSEKWFKKSNKTSNAQLEKVGAKKEELVKFAVQDAPEPEAAPVEAPPVVEPKKPILPPIAAPTKKAPPLKKPVTKKPVTVTSPQVVVTPGFQYPTDYPEVLQELDVRAANSWKLFDPKYLSKEEMFLDVDYLGMTVGKVVLSYMGLKSMQSKPVHHFQAFFKSAPFYSAIYELDDKLDTFVDQEKFVGLRYNLVQRESKQDVDEVQLYDREKLTTNAYQTRVVDGKKKDKKWHGYIPRYSIDALSVLWLIRGMPLKSGDKYVFPIVNKGKTLAMDATVEAREKVKTKIGEFNCIRVKAHTVYTGKTLKSGDMTFWLTDDSKRQLVRAQAKIKIGSVYAEIAKGQ